MEAHMSAAADILAIIITGMLIVTGCAWYNDEPAEETMQIKVDFGDVHRCSRISPEIVITNPPTGTKFFDVRLMERGDVDRLLGGGTWSAEPSGVIPEGALTRHYMGPCPPAGKEGEYVYIISAMAGKDSQPLAVRLYKITMD